MFQSGNIDDIVTEFSVDKVSDSSFFLRGFCLYQKTQQIRCCILVSLPCDECVWFGLESQPAAEIRTQAKQQRYKVDVEAFIQQSLKRFLNLYTKQMPFTVFDVQYVDYTPQSSTSLP